VRKRETRACSSKGVAVSRVDGLGRSSADDIGSRQAGDKKSAMAQKAIMARNCDSEWHAHQRSGTQGLFIPSWDGMIAGMRDVVGQECSAEAQRSSRGRVFTSSRSHAVCGLAEMGLGGSADVGARGLGRVVQAWAGQDRFEVPRQNSREQERQNGRMAEWPQQPRLTVRCGGRGRVPGRWASGGGTLRVFRDLHSSTTYLRPCPCNPARHERAAGGAGAHRP
jgi:hypothetical protein